MSNKTIKEEALEYHKFPKAGKIEIKTTKSFKSKKDLRLAYTPGVAYACEEINNNHQDAFFIQQKEI